MKRKTVILLIRMLFIIIGIQILLLCIAYIIQANKDIKFKYEDVNCTEANATTIELTTSSAKSESTTTEMSSTSFATNTINTTTIADTTTLVNDITKISTATIITTAASETITEGSTTILPTTMTMKTTTQPPFPPTSTTPSSTTQMTSTNASETTNTNATTNYTTKSTTSSESYMTPEDITSAKTNNCRTTDPKFNYVVWNNKTENKTACILSNMTIQINIHYKVEDSQKNKITLTVPTNATTTGICSEKENEITLSWKENFKNHNDKDKKNKITFGYIYNDTDNKSFLNFVSVDIYNFPYTREREIHEDTQHRYLELFPTIKGGVFICKLNTTINVGKQIDVVISDVHLITFNECDEDCSKTEIDCAVRTINNIKVIIIILIVDVILIFIILYLTWRYRRSNFTRFENSVNVIYRK